jgi:hypothetical protein
MKKLERRAQAAMSRLGDRGRTTRIPDDVRAVVVAFAVAARADGATWKEIGAGIGLSASVVQRWCRSASATPTWSRVGVTDDVGLHEGNGAVVLVTPGGYRLEGLDLAVAVRLLAELE